MRCKLIKNSQTKIILIFFILGIIIIGSLTFFELYGLSQIEQTINADNNLNGEAFSNILKEQISRTKIIAVILIGVFAIITLLLGYFVSKAIVKPINKLIKMQKE